MAIIEVENLEKTYKSGTYAVRGVTFQVEEGEIFGFLGPNGAGKSTTMRILTTLSQPTGGRARVGGLDIVKEAQAVRRQIGYVAQDISVSEHATGRENLLLQGQLHRLPAAEVRRRAEELLEMVGLTAEGNRLVATYSGGMRKRLDIASGLMHRPKVLFLDEPTAGLDPQTRASLWDHIRSLNREYGMTVFLTTHYLEEADQLAHRIAILDHGGIVASGTPDQLKQEVQGDGISIQIATQETSGPAGEPTAFGARALSVLQSLPFVRESRIGTEQEILLWVERGAEAVPVVIRELEAAGLRASAITMTRPSLDDVFLKHTGRSIRTEGGTASNEADRARRSVNRR